MLKLKITKTKLINNYDSSEIPDLDFNRIRNFINKRVQIHIPILVSVWLFLMKYFKKYYVKNKNFENRKNFVSEVIFGHTTELKTPPFDPKPSI